VSRSRWRKQTGRALRAVASAVRTCDDRHRTPRANKICLIPSRLLVTNVHVATPRRTRARGSTAVSSVNGFARTAASRTKRQAALLPGQRRAPAAVLCLRRALVERAGSAPPCWTMMRGSGVSEKSAGIHDYGFRAPGEQQGELFWGVPGTVWSETLKTRAHPFPWKVVWCMLQLPGNHKIQLLFR
jgi:hypothetical protein